jgi:hypothetical protein
VLPTQGAGVGVEALIELADRYRLERVDDILTSWAERSGTGF